MTDFLLELFGRIFGGLFVVLAAWLVIQSFGLLVSHEVREIYADIAIRIRKRIAVFILRKFYKEETL